MEQQNNQSNFNVVTNSRIAKNDKKGLIIGALIVLFLAISIPAGVYLVKQQQDIREKAQAALVCPAVEACPVPGETALLRSCDSVATGESPEDISCSTIANVSKITTCGGTKYCCPSLGAAWTRDVQLCAPPNITPQPTEYPYVPLAEKTPTPTASATPSSTPRSTPKATFTPMGSSQSTATATMVPIPVTGTNWPTLVGAGVGILVIIGSILLVL